MARNTVLKSYLSTTGNILYLTPVFTYDITIYRIYKKYVECAYQNQKYSLKYIPIKKDITYKKYKNCTVSISVELIGAPKYYLDKENYREITLDEYKELIKQKRKKKK